MLDLAIRGALIVDGTGGEPYSGDVGIASGRIASVGRTGPAREEIDARGRILTPGFIDIHTHFDGQATWENRLAPSSEHGVTTVVTGNCGVGFAPCRPDDRDALLALMEGVEDVPDVVMAAGLPWTWTSFPEFLDFLDQRQFDVDVAVQIPHSPIRVFVMGQRGVDRAPATPGEIERMAALVEEAIGAGAIGVSTSRFLLHRTKAGKLSPSVDAAEQELLGLAEGLRRAGDGVFQLIAAVDSTAADEYALMRRLVEKSGRPLSFTLVAEQLPNYPGEKDAWRVFRHRLATDQPAGAPIRGQIFPRPIGTLLGLDLSYHPFSLNPSYAPLRDLPLPERVARMRDPTIRARLLAETPQSDNLPALRMVSLDREHYRLGDPPRYDPTPDEEIGRLAARAGRSKADLLYDCLLEDDGKAILYCPSGNFIDHRLDAAGELLRDPNTIVALGDAGAHYGMICDASYPTFLLTYWVRDAAPGAGLNLPDAVRKLSAIPADAVGLSDRGTIAVGQKADLNIIDLERLRLHGPAVFHDLPAGGRRLRQRADGIAATIVSGEVTYRDGLPTGRLSGRLVRRGRTAAFASCTNGDSRS